MTNEQEKKEEEKPKSEDTGEGVQSEADKKIELLNKDTERINQAIAENENAKARQKLGGETDAGAENKPVKPENKMADEIVSAFK